MSSVEDIATEQTKLLFLMREWKQLLTQSSNTHKSLQERRTFNNFNRVLALVFNTVKRVKSSPTLSSYVNNMSSEEIVLTIFFLMALHVMWKVFLLKKTKYLMLQAGKQNNKCGAENCGEWAAKAIQQNLAFEQANIDFQVVLDDWANTQHRVQDERIFQNNHNKYIHRIYNILARTCSLNIPPLQMLPRNL
jgi:hypothetical protein